MRNRRSTKRPSVVPPIAGASARNFIKDEVSETGGINNDAQITERARPRPLRTSHLASSVTDASIVLFDYPAWSQRFPSLAEATNAEDAAFWFDVAQHLFLSNAPGSLVKSVTTRRYLLDLLVAHLAWILRPEAEGGPGPGAVGPVLQASQGSVSVQYALNGQPPAANWFMQSQYGATYWQATSFWRGMRFVASHAPRALYWP